MWRALLSAFLAAAFLACPAPEAPGTAERTEAAVETLPAAAPADPAEGKWRESRAADVRALPYLQGYKPAQDRPLIVAHDPSAIAPGLNLLLSGHAAEAVLMDSQGKTLHRWRYPLRRLWPDLRKDPGMAKLEYWRRAWLFPNGDLLAIYEGLGIVKLNARSEVLWSRRGGFHHDLQVLEDGRIWVLDRDGKVIPRINPDEGVLEDFVTVLDPDGEVVRRISLLESFERSGQASLLARMERSGDIFHTNTLEVLDGRLAGRSPAFRKGNLLVSVLKLDALAIIDPDREEVVWARTGSWRRQHQPTFLDDGNLLLFDNRGPQGERSRVIEIDPLSGGIVWQYGGGPEADLFSKTLGSCQRLANGNTLITESENGRALEVTRDGRRVWEFHNPNRAGERQELVAVLFEMIRLPESFPFRGLGQG